MSVYDEPSKTDGLAEQNIRTRQTQHKDYTHGLAEQNIRTREVLIARSIWQGLGLRFSSFLPSRRSGWDNLDRGQCGHEYRLNSTEVCTHNQIQIQIQTKCTHNTLDLATTEGLAEQNIQTRETQHKDAPNKTYRLAKHNIRTRRTKHTDSLNTT